MVCYSWQHDLDELSFSSVVSIKAQWLSWLERRPVTAEVEGSSPFWVVKDDKSFDLNLR